MRAFIGIVLLALLGSGCERDCGPDARSTSSMAAIRGADGAELGLVYVNFGEERGESNWRALSVSFNGPGNQAASPLRGHILGARLIRDDGEPLLELETHHSPEYAQVIVITRTESSLAANRFEAMRQDLVAGRVIVEITTDLAGLQTIATRMPAAANGGFRRAQCPGFLD